LAQGAGLLDADTYFSQGTRDAARHAAGTAAAFACRLIEGRSRAGFLALRPPGHHATRTRAMGFCLLNNVAVAAHAALARGASRVAIVDWDVHHGNGTQDIFADDERVLFVSLHQAPLYPGTGASCEIGGPRALGRTVNLPLPAGSGASAYRAALDRVVQPVLMQFAPDLILVSAGFDAHRDDPLSDMALNDEDYGALTRTLWRWACDLGHGRLGLLLEGGYDLRALRDAGHAVAQALLGKDYALPAGVCAPAAARAIDEARRALSPYWEI
jgi:acetoin utilization deacetylase AcuC-like enzyme